MNMKPSEESKMNMKPSEKSIMNMKPSEERHLRKAASYSNLKGEKAPSLKFCDDSGYSSDSSSTSASSSRQKLYNYNVSKDSVDDISIPFVNCSFNSRVNSTPADSFRSLSKDFPSPKVSSFNRCNSTPIGILRSFKELKSPKVSPIEGPLLRSKSHPNYSSESSQNLLNISGASECSQSSSPDTILNKTNKGSEKKSYISLRSPLKSPFKLFKKPKSVEDVSDNVFTNPEVKERTVKALFTSKDKDKHVTHATKIQKCSNIFINIMGNANYLLPNIFSHLSDEDLFSASHVCKQFRFIIHENSKLKCRKRLFIKNKKEERERIGKENFKQKPATLTSSLLSLSSPRKHFQQLQNSATYSPQKQVLSSSKPLTRFDKFVKEGKKLLPGESQTKCVHCQNPARMIISESKALCTDPVCSYIYCTRCLMPFHEKPSDCISLKPRPSVSSASKLFSKAYKKRLRRL